MKIRVKDCTLLFLLAICHSVLAQEPVEHAEFSGTIENRTEREATFGTVLGTLGFGPPKGFLYEIRTTDGTLRLVRSSNSFSVGSCVRFSGKPDGPSQTHFSNARVEGHTGCPSMPDTVRRTATPAGTIAETVVVERLTDDAVTVNLSKGVILLAIRWDRRWKCGGFENAQLRAVGFDKLPSTKTNDDASPDILLEDAPLLLTKPTFDNYAFLVEPGDYGLSRLEIKVARSTSDVGFFKTPRSRFLKEGQSLGGTFTVAAGEVVYLGHFYLDCYQQPTLWRYYAEGRNGFNDYLASIKKIYRSLDTTKVTYRLFQTKEFGQEYKLP